MPFIDCINSVDFAILDFIQNTIRCSFLDTVMTVLSYMGEAGIFWIAAAIVMLFFKKTRAIGAMVLAAMALGYVVGELGIKNIVCRPRPFVLNPAVVPVIAPPSGFSFPSGHSCSSFAAATVIFVCNKRLGIPAVILAALIAFSRLYNYVHFPSDVLCGILLGIACAAITVALFRKTGLENRISGNEDNTSKRADSYE